MPFFLVLDVVALSASTIIAASLTLMVLGAGLKRGLDRAFALFVVIEAVWASLALSLRMMLWLERGDPLVMAEWVALAFSLLGPCLLAFAVRYVGRSTRWADLAVGAGVVVVAALSIPLFQHQFVFDPRLDPNGSTLLSLSGWGFMAAVVPAVYFIWSLVLFSLGVRRGRGVFLALSVFVMLVGFVVGGLLNVAFLVVSVTNTVGMAVLGYGVVSRQLFNPLRDLTRELERRVEERTEELEKAYREVERAYAEVEGWVDERTAELKQEIAERKRVEAERAELLRALQHRSTQLQTAAEVSKSASMILDTEVLIDQVVRLIQERFDFYYVGLFLIDEAGEYAVLRAGTGEAFRRMLEAGHRLRVGGPSMIGWCTAHAEARVALDVGEEAIRFDNPLLPRTRSELALPLVSRGRCIGALTVQSVKPNAFAQEDVAVLQTMADQVAVAIENARLLEAERKRSAELELLRQASLHVTSSLELHAVLEAILEHALQLIAADDARIFLYDGERLTFGAAIWGGAAQRQPYTEPRPGGLTHAVASSGERIVIPDVSAHPHIRDWEWGGAVVGLPLRVGDEVRGVMNIAFEEPRTFSESELNLLELLADQAAIAIHNAWLHQEVRLHAHELAEALARQEELDRLKGEFIQNVSHELRSPLALIRGYAEMLEGGQFGALQAGQRGPVSIIARRSRMLSDLVEDITLILGTETRPPKQGLVALDEVARMAAEDFRLAADQAGLRLTADIAKVSPVLSNATYLRRVLDNLLGNAIKFTPPGGAIHVRLWQVEDRIWLEVRDTGIGIPPDQLERIFERFYQVDGSARRRYGGVGLGLALVKEVVELFGGEVAVRSQEGEGSTFTVMLPAAKEGAGSEQA